MLPSQRVFLNNGKLKWFILFLASVFVTVSLFFTFYVIKKLKEREHQKISLYTKTVEYFANKGNNPDLNFLFDDLIIKNTSIPVILTDELGIPLDFKNIPEAEKASSMEERNRILLKEVIRIEQEREPLLVTLLTPEEEVIGYRYVYYKNSKLLIYLTYFPFIQIIAVLLISLIAYYIFNLSKQTEQNNVWAGLAKETAHQIGTPLSSMMAWLEYLKENEHLENDECLEELEKDVKRLETITSRFSHIGSVPVLETENIQSILDEAIGYIRKRISRRVEITFDHPNEALISPINKSLFEWVVENLIKNGVDAMSGKGKLQVFLIESGNGEIIIDITDSGKGIPKNKFKKVFYPGYTTKKRGWGLGLTLSKRIIENYHHGKIFVKHSKTGVGTTFRIVLNGENSAKQEQKQ